MPTLAAISGARVPKTDGVSFLPTLTGDLAQEKHDYLYWEYAGQTAVRRDRWKAYQSKKGIGNSTTSQDDVEEKNNLAKKNASVLGELIELAEKAHEPMRPGNIYDRELTNKDHRQAPHARNVKYLRSQLPN